MKEVTKEVSYLVRVYCMCMSVYICDCVYTCVTVWYTYVTVCVHVFVHVY